MLYGDTPEVLCADFIDQIKWFINLKGIEPMKATNYMYHGRLDHYADRRMADTAMVFWDYMYTTFHGDING